MVYNIAIVHNLFYLQKHCRQNIQKKNKTKKNKQKNENYSKKFCREKNFNESYNIPY